MPTDFHRSVVFVCAFLLFLMQGTAQTYSMVAYQQGIIHQLDYGINGAGVSVCDINKDGLDDITFCNSGEFPIVYINNGNGFDLFPNMGSIELEVKQVNWVDYDNDGDRDMTFTCYQGPMFIFEQVDSMQFVDVTMNTGLNFNGYETYGASWSDYDRDGDLDVYIANYNAPYFGDPTIENFLYQNNGDGTFVDVTSFAGVGDGSTYSFLGIWMYSNDDLWPDLFVSNDRYDSSNSLYINNGDGTFTNVSEYASIAYYILSMGVTVDDFDNDGDDDLYVADALSNLLLENVQGIFQNVSSSLNASLNKFTWGTMFMDFDNDGLKDIYAATAIHFPQNGQNQMLHQTSSGFVNVTNSIGMMFDNEQSYGSAYGDFNMDGSLDIVSLELAPDYSKLWQSNPNNNHWLKVQLHGSLTNKDGIGARIKCFLPELTQTQVVRCGESYLSQNSFTEHFGLNSHDLVDSLMVQWPSGTIDTWYRIEADQVLNLHEGHGFRSTIEVIDAQVICAGNNAQIMIGDNISQLINWNNGESDSILITQSEGLFWARVRDEFNNTFLSNEVEIAMHESFLLSYTIDPALCSGDLGSLTIAENQDLLMLNFDNEELTNLTFSLQPGMHYLTWIDTNGCSSSDAFETVQPIELSSTPNIVDNICFGEADGYLAWNLTGGTEPYQYLEGEEVMEGLTAGPYHLHAMDANGCSFYDTLSIEQNEPIAITVEWTGPSCFGESDALVEFTVVGATRNYSSITSWTTNQPIQSGEHFVSVSDALGCTATEYFTIVEPQPINVVLEVNPSLINATNGSASIEVSGGIAPYQIWWSNGGGDVMEVDGLAAGNYQVQVVDANGCSWDTLFAVMTAVTINDVMDDSILFWPNPVDSWLRFSKPISYYSIWDCQGRCVQTQTCACEFIELSGLAAGIYTIQVDHLDSRKSRHQFIKH